VSLLGGNSVIGVFTQEEGATIFVCVSRRH